MCMCIQKSGENIGSLSAIGLQFIFLFQGKGLSHWKINILVSLLARHLLESLFLPYNTGIHSNAWIFFCMTSGRFQLKYSCLHSKGSYQQAIIPSQHFFDNTFYSYEIFNFTDYTEKESSTDLHFEKSHSKFPRC